jgi:hypothetical protein
MKRVFQDEKAIASVYGMSAKELKEFKENMGLE